MKLLKYAIVALAMVLAVGAAAQNDTEFWFGAPENEDNNNTRDQPIYIRVATFNQASTVTLTQPARPQFVPIIANIPPNGNYTFDLTSFKNIIETFPQNQPLNYGLKLTSTTPITAYYEQSSTSNPDIFTLKGKNALGTRFIVPSQTTYYNSQRGDLGDPKYFWFVIVAKENNTQVTITPTTQLEGGFQANQPFSITLQQGQTYACRSTGQSPAEHPAGTLITSNKPIAVTINDDSMCICQSCFDFGPDLVGDQLISNTLFGKEYILIRGFLNDGDILNPTPLDRAYIFADSANTVITINGVIYPTIGQGEYIDFAFGSNEAVYLTSNKPVEVMHLSGSNPQPAGAIIPPIECTGSNEIVFTRSATGSLFGLIIFTRLGNEGFFSVNTSGTNTFAINASDFSVVPNTAGQWVYARLQPNNNVSINQAYRVSNSAGLFHLGVLYGASSTNARYGFYSNFASVNLGPDQTICPGDSLLLDAGAGKDTYLWNTGATTHSIWVKNPGEYYVDVTDYLCQLSDTMVLSHYATAPINLGNDTSICAGTTITLDAGPGFATYNWSNGGHNQTTTVGPGTYTITASIEGGCNSTDTIVIGEHPLPPVNTIKHN